MAVAYCWYGVPHTQLVDGNQRIVNVNEPPSDNEEFLPDLVMMHGVSNYIYLLSIGMKIVLVILLIIHWYS